MSGYGNDGYGNQGPISWGQPDAGGWYAPPASPPPPPPEPRSKLPVVLASIAAVVVIGAMAFVVAGGGHSDSPTPAELAASGSQQSATVGSAAAPSAEALEAKLSALMPTNSEVSALTKADQPGADWRDVQEAYATPADTVPDCLPDLVPGQGGYVRRWVLQAPDGTLHGDATVRAMQYATADDAASAVTARQAESYRACYLGQTEDDLRSEVGDDIDPASISAHAEATDPSGAVASISTSEGYRVGGGTCTRFTDETWQQVDTIVISTRFTTCLTPFDTETEQQITAGVTAHAQS